jgi:flagellar biosynthesis/type III secretory pathway chaperone
VEVAMSAFSMLLHNGSLVRKAEKMLNDFLGLNKENHKAYLYIENPDGTVIRLQQGFKIKDYEYVVTELIE